MDVRYIATTSDKLSELAIVNGQLIYLSDMNATYYDMGGTRRLVSSVKVVSALPSTSAAQESVIYGIVNDSGNVDASIWDANARTFRQLSGYKATANSLGLVQPDGITITVDSNGVISSSPQTTSIAADHVTYDNTSSGLPSTAAQGAIDDLKTLTDSAAAAASSAAQDATAALTALASKADKVTNATSGNFAGLDATGNLTDSGKGATDFTGKTFDGTSEEWAALSVTQKAEYAGGLVLIKNDNANAMLIDNVPTANSNNLVKSGGVYTALQDKMPLTPIDSAPTASSNNPVSSDGVYNAINPLSTAVNKKFKNFLEYENSGNGIPLWDILELMYPTSTHEEIMGFMTDPTRSNHRSNYLYAIITTEYAASASSYDKFSSITNNFNLCKELYSGSIRYILNMYTYTRYDDDLEVVSSIDEGASVSTSTTSDSIDNFKIYLRRFSSIQNYSNIRISVLQYGTGILSYATTYYVNKNYISRSFQHYVSLHKDADSADYSAFRGIIIGGTGTPSPTGYTDYSVTIYKNIMYLLSVTVSKIVEDDDPPETPAGALVAIIYGGLPNYHKDLVLSSEGPIDDLYINKIDYIPNSNDKLYIMIDIVRTEHTDTVGYSFNIKELCEYYMY